MNKISKKHTLLLAHTAFYNKNTQNASLLKNFFFQI